MVKLLIGEVTESACFYFSEAIANILLEVIGFLSSYDLLMSFVLVAALIGKISARTELFDKSRDSSTGDIEVVVYSC